MDIILIEITKTVLLASILVLLGIDITVTYRKVKCEEELLKKINNHVISADKAMDEALDIIGD